MEEKGIGAQKEMSTLQMGGDRNLNNSNKTMYYEAIGEIISAEKDQATQIEYIRTAVRPMYESFKKMLQSSQNNARCRRIF